MSRATPRLLTLKETLRDLALLGDTLKGVPMFLAASLRAVKKDSVGIWARPSSKIKTTSEVEILHFETG